MSERLLTEIRDLLVLLVKADARSTSHEWLTEGEFVDEQMRHLTQVTRVTGQEIPTGFEDQLRERYRRDGGYRQLSRREQGLGS